MTDLFDEIAAMSVRSMSVCSVCEWLRTRTDDRADFEAALADKQRFTAPAIYKAMRKRGYTVQSDSGVARHRRFNHVAD